MIQSSIETFRREKKCLKHYVSSTREFWNLRSKTKSWNFDEVRWRPYSPKESFKDDFVVNLNPPDGGFFIYLIRGQYRNQGRQIFPKQERGSR